MDPTLVLGRRHTLHPVHAGLELQAREHAPAGDLGDALLQPAQFGVAIFQDLVPPAAQCRILLIHLEQFRGEQAGLVTSGGGADFQDR